MYNTISQLQKILVKPKTWVAYPCDGEQGLNLYFCHTDSKDLLDFCPIMTARGKAKIYKTLEALCRDAYLVDDHAQVIVSPVTHGCRMKQVAVQVPDSFKGYPF